ncbi:MAG: sulfurtransferase [Alphaproteobacteria bacterium]
MTEPLIQTETLAQRLADPAVRVVDATWYLPTDKKDPTAEFLQAHIPGAARFDISEICDAAQKAPHMLPSPEQFARQVGALGLGNGNHIVVYDKGEYAAARVWWMFRVFGHDNVSVLDGGFGKWQAEHRPTESGPAHPRPAQFVPQFRRHLVRSMDDMRENLRRHAEQVVDARPPARFAGELPEIRAGVDSGHIPGSHNLFYAETISPDSKQYLPPAEIERKFRAAGFDLTRPIVATCGSGVSACQLALALYLTGRKDIPIYDGSWAEWGSHKDNPKVLGRT